jgi:hypothetical protein
VLKKRLRNGLAEKTTLLRGFHKLLHGMQF